VTEGTTGFATEVVGRIPRGGQDSGQMDEHHEELQDQQGHHDEDPGADRGSHPTPQGRHSRVGRLPVDCSRPCESRKAFQTCPF
jgi:hypothetical protein